MVTGERAKAFGLCVMFGMVGAHWNSEVNLSGGRRLQEGTDESINSKWQCDPQTTEVRSDETTPPSLLVLLLFCASVGHGQSHSAVSRRLSL